MVRLAIFILASRCLLAQMPVDQHKREARRLLAANEIVQSIAEWQAALHDAPEDPDCLLGLGVAEDALGHYADANRSLSHAEQIAPRSTAVLNNLAINSLHLGEDKKAIQFFRRSLDLDPNNQNALYNLATLYLNSSDWSDSEALLAHLFSLRSDDSEIAQKLSTVCTHLASLDLRAGRLEQSLSRYRRAIELTPAQPEGYIGAAFVLSKNESIQAAQEVLDEAMRRFPNNARLLLEWGYVRQLVHDSAGAVEAYSRVLRLEPDSLLGLVFLGRAYRQEGKLDQSEQVLRKATRLTPPAALAKYELAETLLQMHSTDADVSALLEEASALDPSRPEPPYLLGKLALQAGDLPRAQTFLMRSNEADPASPSVHYLLAQLYRRMEQPEKAARETAEYQRLKNHPSSFDLTSLQQTLQQ